MKPTDERLLPCPFCGGEAERRLNDFSLQMTMVHCITCGASAFDRKWEARTSILNESPWQGSVPAFVTYEIWQNDMCEAGSSDYNDALHYASVYAQDGPFELRKITSYSEVIDIPPTPKEV